MVGQADRQKDLQENATLRRLVLRGLRIRRLSYASASLTSPPLLCHTHRILTDNSSRSSEIPKCNARYTFFDFMTILAETKFTSDISIKSHPLKIITALQYTLGRETHEGFDIRDFIV